MIKFNQHHVTDGTVKARVIYSAYETREGVKRVALYARDYSGALGRIFAAEHKNETDIMTDYFDKGSVWLDEGHPLYAAAFERWQANEAKHVEKRAAREAKAEARDAAKRAEREAFYARLRAKPRAV